MNEVMLTESLGKNFLFSENEFNRVSPESDTLKKYIEPLSINPTVFNYKMNIEAGKGTDSHSEDSILCNSHDTFGKPSDNRIQPVLNSVYSDSSSAEFEIVSVNVKNTTVINTTYNLIAQSIVRNADKKEFMSSSLHNLQKSPQKPSTAPDKSRVVVQVLTSNAENCEESQTVVENKNISAQSSNICSFRDDVFNILSKKMSTCDSKYQFLKSQKVKDMENKRNCYQSSNVSSFRDEVFNIFSKAKHDSCDVKNDNSIEALQTEDAVNNESDMEITSKLKSSNLIVRSQRKKNLNFFFLNGKGTKLSEIEFVASNLKNASSRLLRILHYVLFDTYGPCNSGLQISKTKKNILRFCGYPFKKDSESYLKKGNCLQRLPFPILHEMHQAIIESDCNNRSEMVTQLVNFFMEPKAHYFVEDQAETFKKDKCQKDVSRNDSMDLKAIALEDCLPVVKVKRLTEKDIEKLQNQTKLDSGFGSNETDSSGDFSNYFLPAYILKGPGRKLNSFPKIVKKICRSKSRMIEILHYILYGRIEATQTCVKNILEFSGFLPCQKDFISEREAMLNNMDHFELFQLCNILCLSAKTNTRDVRIKKILEYLSKPTEPRKGRNFRKNMNKKPLAMTPKSKFGYPYFQRSIDKASPAGTPQLKYRKPNFQRSVKKDQSILTPKLEYKKTCYSEKKEKVNGSELQDKSYPLKKGKFNGSELEDLKNTSPQKKESVDGPKLRDFINICSNIECASPSDLTELNDLLFIKPCDESEIHQKILDFAPFNFSSNSIEYHYRKTLLHYMSFCIIKKIAQLLDIENWEKSNCQADLSSSILNFLIEMKPVKQNPHPRKASPPSSMSALDDTLAKKVNSDKPDSQILQIYKEKTEEKWCFKKGPQTIQNHRSPFDHRYSDRNRNISPHKNQAVSKKSVFIHKLTKASLCADEIPQNGNDGLPKIISQNAEDATPLRAILHHPSDLELQQMITNIIKSDLWSSTMGELVQKVYHCYPDFNISYRENFIRKEARQIIAQLRSNAVDTINSMQCKVNDVI